MHYYDGCQQLSPWAPLHLCSPVAGETEKRSACRQVDAEENCESLVPSFLCSSYVVYGIRHNSK